MVDGVLDKAEVRAAGAVVHGLLLRRGGDGDAVRGKWLRRAFLPTGQCNVIGNPSCRHQDLRQSAHRAPHAEHIDVDVSGITRKEINMDQAGDKLLEMMFRTANGRFTAAEALGHREFVLTRLYESA